LLQDKRLHPFVNEWLKLLIRFAGAVWQSRNNAKLKLRQAGARPWREVIPDGL